MAGVVAVMLGLALVGVVAWAWIDGGREPLREMAQPVAVPEGAR